MRAPDRPTRRELIWPLIWCAPGLIVFWRTLGGGGAGDFIATTFSISIVGLLFVGGYPVLPFFAACLALIQRRRGPLAVPLFFSAVGLMAFPVVLIIFVYGAVTRLSGSLEAWQPVVMWALLLSSYYGWLYSAWRLAMPKCRPGEQHPRSSPKTFAVGYAKSSANAE